MQSFKIFLLLIAFILVGLSKTLAQDSIQSKQKPMSKELSGVTVTSKRPLIEQRTDRTIVNVDASVTNTGTNIMEVLEKSPGISVDRDGNISLKGKNGVTVLVDGRPTQLSGEDLANMLRSMPSSQVDQIEIMTNPPARYDAAGGSGIINLRTKKITTAGYNGSAAVNFGIGRYPKTNESFVFNYRNNKLNFFSNLNHNYRKSFGVLAIQRKVLNSNGTADTYFEQASDMLVSGNSLNVRIGVDYFLSKKTTIGLALNAGSNPGDNGTSTLINIADAGKNPVGITTATNDQDRKWKTVNANLNFRKVLQPDGRELTADLDFLRYNSGVSQLLINSYYEPDGNVGSRPDTLTGWLPQHIDVVSTRIDYSHPISKETKFEAGIKSSYVKTDNNARYDSILSGIAVTDLNRSNHFVYEENINAAYANFNTTLTKKWSVQLGLRLENTIAKGEQLTTKEKFSRNYTQLFPTAYVQFKLNEKNSLNGNFGRRIRRPGYGSLNPFIRFIDRYTYTQGNPLLKPALSNNFEIAHNWRNQITTTINYTYTSDIIEGVIEQRGDEAYRRPANISSLRQYGVSVDANNKLNKWWTSILSVNVFNNRSKGQINNVAVMLSATTIMLNGTQQFQVSKGLTAEINGWFRNGSVDGYSRTRPVGGVGAGAGIQVLNGKGSIRASIRDILWTQRSRVTSQYANVDFNFQERNESRVATIGFTYRFSKGKKIAPIKRTTGSAGEEQQRIGQ